jgi:hypothetical protein
VVKILGNIRAAMGNNPNATVLIADRVLRKKGSLVSTEVTLCHPPQPIPFKVSYLQPLLLSVGVLQTGFEFC